MPPLALLTRRFLLTYLGKRDKEKREHGEEKKGKSKKGRWKFGLGVPKWGFSTRKKHFMPGKKIRKNDYAPLKIIPLKPLVMNMNPAKKFLSLKAYLEIKL